MWRMREKRGREVGVVMGCRSVEVDDKDAGASRSTAGHKTWDLIM